MNTEQITPADATPHSAKRMPAQKPGRSEQSVGTPRVFLDAVEARFGTINLDVAASPDNAVCSRYYALERGCDGLRDPWVGTLNWCNPPFSQIAPWVAKARSEAGRSRESLLLVPASVGANWWRDHVHHLADVYFLNGRLTFVGHQDPYPRDLALLRYGAVNTDYLVWDWRADRVWG